MARKRKVAVAKTSSGNPIHTKRGRWVSPLLDSARRIQVLGTVTKGATTRIAKAAEKAGMR